MYMLIDWTGIENHHVKTRSIIKMLIKTVNSFTGEFQLHQIPVQDKIIHSYSLVILYGSSKTTIEVCHIYGTHHYQVVQRVVLYHCLGFPLDNS